MHCIGKWGKANAGKNLTPWQMYLNLKSTSCCGNTVQSDDVWDSVSVAQLNVWPEQMLLSDHVYSSRKTTSARPSSCRGADVTGGFFFLFLGLEAWSGFDRVGISDPPELVDESTRQCYNVFYHYMHIPTAREEWREAPEWRYLMLLMECNTFGR